MYEGALVVPASTIITLVFVTVTISILASAAQSREKPVKPVNKCLYSATISKLMQKIYFKKLAILFKAYYGI